MTSSVKERRKGACQREGMGVASGDCREGTHRGPRNPDGSGPMYVLFSLSLEMLIIGEQLQA